MCAFLFARSSVMPASVGRSVAYPPLGKLVTASLICFALGVPTASAQQDAPRQRETGRPAGVDGLDFELDERERAEDAGSARDRDWLERGGDPMERDRDRLERDLRRDWLAPGRGRLAPGGEADRRLAPRPWRPPSDGLVLGVYASPAEVGYRVDGVLRGSPASRVGLEPGDLIVAVDGFQIGRVGRGFYPLGPELQVRGRDDLRVVLLVQNVRNRRLLNLDVDFRTPSSPRPFFRDRQFAEQGSEPRARQTPQHEPDDAEVEGERTGELQ